PETRIIRDGRTLDARPRLRHTIQVQTNPRTTRKEGGERHGTHQPLRPTRQKDTRGSRPVAGRAWYRGQHKITHHPEQRPRRDRTNNATTQALQRTTSDGTGNLRRRNPTERSWQRENGDLHSHSAGTDYRRLLQMRRPIPRRTTTRARRRQRHLRDTS